MGAKQNFNLGGINSHFNGLKDAGNMSPTQLALTYSKEQLQHMAQMGVINPTNAVIAGMNIDRISNTNAPPTSTISQDTFAPQQPQQGQLPQRSADPSNFSKQFSADALNPPLPKGNAQGGIMSIPRPGQKYQQGGVVAFKKGDEVEAKYKVKEPIYDEDAEFEQYKDKHQRARGRNYGERPLFDSNSKAGLMANPEIEQNSMVWKGLTPKERLDMAQRDIQFNKDHPDSARLNSLIGKEPAGVGALAAQSARPGAGAGAPPAAPVLSNIDPAFLAMLKGREGSPANEKVSEGSNDALNRALIRGGAAMMANRDPAIGSGLQGFLQTAGKGATEGLTGYEQQTKEFKDRKVKQDELAATERYRTRANELDAARTGVTYGLERDKAAALPIAAEKDQKMHERIAQIQAGARPYDLDQEYMNPNTTPERRKQIETLYAVKNPRANARDFSTEQQIARAKLWYDTIQHQPENAKLTEAARTQKGNAYIYGGSGGGGYQPTKEQLAALNRNLIQK